MLSYPEAVERLLELGHELHQMPSQSHKFDLDHMRVFAEALGHPEQTVPSVLIAGTNGKGSTAATLASILQTSGYNVGLYTSPHLIRINERIRINGEPITDELFAAAYADYSRGNYDLALSEFRQYVETYPSSELADNAQYWTGEILYSQRKFPAAVVELEKVAAINPKGDKAAAALYKRGLVLIEMGNKEDGVAQLLSVVRNYPKTPEAGLATQQLQQIAPEALEPPAAEPQSKKNEPVRTKTRKP